MPTTLARFLPPLTLFALLAGPTPRAPAQPGPPAAARVDLAGDPLPAGALARMGTVRLREKGVAGLVALSPDGKLLASLSEAPLVRFWDADTGKEVDSLGGQYFTSLAFSPD